MADPVFPKSVRLSALILYSHNQSLKTVGKKLGISYQTVWRWAKKCKVGTFDRLTEEQAEEKLEIYAEEMRALSEDETDPVVIRAREAMNRHKFGGSIEHQDKAKREFAQLGGNLYEFEDDLKEHFGLALEKMKSATSQEQQIEAVIGGITLRQWIQVLNDPPPVTTMADMEKLSKITRETFRLDEKKNGQGDSVDLSILNAKTVRGKVVDAEPVVKKRAKKKVPKKR